MDTSFGPTQIHCGRITCHDSHTTCRFSSPNSPALILSKASGVSWLKSPEIGYKSVISAKMG